jgi:hypothetical protein
MATTTTTTTGAVTARTARQACFKIHWVVHWVGHDVTTVPAVAVICKTEQRARARSGGGVSIFKQWPYATVRGLPTVHH